MANNKDDWRNVDMSELSEQGRSLYDQMKAAYRQYAEHKATFEAYMNNEVADSMPEGQELKFGYMFGKLSVAIGPKRAEKVKAVDSGRSLADWLRDKAASGDRS